MQTFLPYPDFRASAAALDARRLGKQRVETMQIMRALSLPAYGWQHHPAVAMWRGHRPALMAYQDAVCDEWEARGFADTCRAKTLADLDRVAADGAAYRSGRYEPPSWLGMTDFHLAHRSNLLRKDPEYYGARFPGVAPDLEYVWPSRTGLETRAGER